IWLGGLGFRERSKQELSQIDQDRSKVYWAAAYGLGLYDVIRAAYFQACHFVLARRSGDVYEFGRALTTEALFLATAGNSSPKWINRLLDTAEALNGTMRAREPQAAEYADQMIEMARGVQSFFSGRWREALQTWQEVADYLRTRCQG